MKNKTGGKKHKKGKNRHEPESKYTPYPIKGQLLGRAHKMLGNKRLLVKCSDDKERLAIIPGRFKGKKNWISVGMILLLNLRDYEDAKCDVAYIYSNNDVKRLTKEGLMTPLLEKDTNDYDAVDFIDDTPKGGESFCYLDTDLNGTNISEDLSLDVSSDMSNNKSNDKSIDISNDISLDEL